MPIYGYACTNCGHTLDALQKIDEPTLVDCPECEQAALKRQLSAPRFRLKGKGWYETDFKSDNQRNLAGEKKPETADSKTDGNTDGKADAKPAHDKTSAAKPEKTVSTKPPKDSKSTA